MTKDEIMEAFWSAGHKQISEDFITQVIAQIDLDGQGEIEFQEFLLTTISPMDMLTEHTISQAFIIFD